MLFTSTVSPTLEFGLRLIGVWPDVPYGIVSQFVLLTSTILVQYFQYGYIIAQCQLGNMKNIIDSLTAAAYYSLTMIKLVTLWMNRRVIREVLASMDTDWCECLNVDRHLYFMTKKASISHLCSKVLFSFNTLAAALILASDNAVDILQLAMGANDTSRPFPIKMLFPFEAEQSPIYELLVVGLFLHGMANMFTVTFVSMLILTLVLHASGQIDIMCEDMKMISEELPYYGSSGQSIGILVKRHHKVITFSENVDKLYSFIALAQVFLNTLIIITSGFFLMTADDQSGGVVIKAIFAYGAIIVEIFIYCSTGEYLSLKSKSLADAAYDSLWYNMSCNHGKDLLFIIMRSQKQLTIRVGQMKNLSLNAFGSILKASASYISVLHAMY